ncbi:MAG: glycosyltransferase family 4 protein [Anaerolineae bacterium]|nr:glycosyltransferase family 4 protein [Anaerolineae bacterium]
MYRIGFVIEQALGHVTHGLNLKKNVAADSEIEAHWILPAWQTEGFASKIPGYKSNWTLQAGLQARSQIGKLQRSVPLDGLFFHTQVPAVLSQNWMKRFPSVVSLDATPLQYDRLGDFYDHETGPSWMENKKYELNVSCYQEARHLVTWSAWAKAGLVAEYQVAADKITVIPPGVNPSEWKRPFSVQPSSANNPVKILFVGGNLERKGGAVLLAAFRRLRARLVENEAGDGETAVELHLVTKDKVTPEAGVFVYHDMQPNSAELKALFHQSDLFCLPSYGDCLPMALSEAGAASLPLISTNVAAIPEIVQDGYSGLLVEPGDVAGLETALQTLVADPALRQEMGSHAQTLVATTFDAEKNAQTLLDLLKREIKKAA